MQGDRQANKQINTTVRPLGPLYLPVAVQAVGLNWLAH